MLIYGHDRAIAEWVLERVPERPDFGPCVAIGVPNKDHTRLIAGVVYHFYQPHHGVIELSMAAESPMWARHDVISELLAYPFKQLGCYKVFTCTDIANEKALRVNYHIGFTREAVLAHQFGKNRHCVICRLLQPEYDRKYGARHAASSES